MREPLRGAGVVRGVGTVVVRLGRAAVATVLPTGSEGDVRGLDPSPVLSRCDQSDSSTRKGEEREEGPFGGRSSRPLSKGLILAQNERWRRGLGMQVVRARPSG